MNEQSKSKWYWRWLRRSLIGLAILVTLAAAAITEEDWRGKHEWENYKREAAARGEPVQPIVAPIADDQNFAKAPVFAGLWAMKWNETQQSWVPDQAGGPDRLQMRVNRANDGGPDVSVSWKRGTLAALPVWQHYYRTPPVGITNEFPVSPQPQSPALDVLLALSKYDSVIEELRRASQRPYLRLAEPAGDFDLRAFSERLGYLADFKYCFQVVELRAEAELAAGQNEQAFADVKLLLRLNDLLGQEPLLISHLVNLATMNITLQPIYEGLVRHQWSDAQLVELARNLAARDFLADYQSAMRGERAYGISNLENMRKHRNFDPGSGATKPMGFQLTPAAVFYQNELAVATRDEKYCRQLVDLTNRIVSPAIVRREEAAANREIAHFHPYTEMALLTLPGIIKSVEGFTEVQADTDLAQVACALERYRLARGEYPETLAVLAPQFIAALPHDVINGQPLHYRRTTDGNFILYSVGWNETDDGGQIGLRKDGSLDREQGDWVWNSAAK